ncbi:MAG: hypothetical protein EOM41_01025 [Bacilli bacterium]|nr:hypothetical protein [Bacilli bacterium]
MNYQALELFEQLKSGETTKDRLSKRAYKTRHKPEVTDKDFRKLASIHEAIERYNVWLRQSSTTPIKQDVGVIKQDVSQQ